MAYAFDVWRSVLMQSINVAQEGIGYLWLCLREYSKGCLFVALFVLGLAFVIAKGSTLEKKVFLPQAVLLLITVYNPLFPVALNRFFDVNNEYYRFFWIAPVVILDAWVMVRLILMAKGKLSAVLFAAFAALIIFGGQFLYKDGYIPSPTFVKMPTEIPQICEMIHRDAEGRYDGDYYPRAICEFDYEMCLRQYDASIMLSCTREQYLTAVTGQLRSEDIISEEEFYSRLLTVMVHGNLIPASEFKKGLEKTGTEYVCVSTVNEALCDYLESRCSLRLVGKTANHSLYHYELEDGEGWRLPDYSDVWENY